MTSKETIEEKLEKLAQAITPDNKLVENVMSRIDAEPIGESSGIWNLRNKLISRRFIMNRFTKLTAAAMIIIAVVLSITFLDKSVAPAYAVEQTVEALKNVRFMHIVRRNEAGQIKDERWIEIGPDGIQARYRQDTPPNFFVVDNLDSIFIHYKDRNTVLLYGPDGQRYTWIWNLGEFFEDLAGQSSITIQENVDYWGRKTHLIRWLKSNQDCYIDPETKLPIAIGNYEISYEEPPEDIFDIPAIPDGVMVVDKRPGAEPIEEPEWLKNEDIAQENFDEARHALATRQYLKAAELFGCVVEAQPMRNWAWFWMGKAHYELGQYNAAIYEFSKVIDMASKFQKVLHYCHLARGFAYRAKGMEDMARKDFRVALPVMLDALRHIEGARIFDRADDSLCRDADYESPSKEQSLAIMINRLRIITGQNFGYDPNASATENEQAIAAWEDWFKNSGKIEFTPDAELVPVLTAVDQEEN